MQNQVRAENLCQSTLTNPMIALHWMGTFESVNSQVQRAYLLEELQMPPDFPSTQLRAEAGSFWLACPAIGAIRFEPVSNSISAFPKRGLDSGVFERRIVRDWLPLVYQSKGFQVLHASAAVHLASHRVVAFSGLAGAGKSTLGFGLGQRPGWQQVADESLALSLQDGHISLVHIPNFPRLRPASAVYFGLISLEQGMLEWPQVEMNFEHVFFLEESSPNIEQNMSTVRVFPLGGADTYRRLLQQAFALTLNDHKHNQQLMQDYLQIACQITAHRLVFQKSIACTNKILDVVEDLVFSIDSADS